MFKIFKKKTKIENHERRIIGDDELVLGSILSGKTAYKDYLNILKEKSENAIRITVQNKDLKFLGEYVDEYPEMHIVEVYEGINKTVYRLDKK